MLVDGGSASASEIVAGALHDRGRATLVGTKTYGKGTVQQWTQLEGDSGGFRLTIARWLTPLKTWIHGVGITPDVVVTEQAAKPGDDPVLDAGLKALGVSGYRRCGCGHARLRAKRGRAPRAAGLAERGTSGRLTPRCARLHIPAVSVTVPPNERR